MPQFLRQLCWINSRNQVLNGDYNIPHFLGTIKIILFCHICQHYSGR